MPNGVTFIDHSDDVRRLLEGATEATAREIGGKIANYARQGLGKAKGPMGNPWPTDVITAVRQSIAVEVEKVSGGYALQVGSNMQVGPYIELGTGKLYDPPPEWIEYHGDDAHSVGGLDWWLYFDPLEGVVKIGKPVPSQPFLRPAVLDHVAEYKDITKKNMENA